MLEIVDIQYVRLQITCLDNNPQSGGCIIIEIPKYQGQYLREAFRRQQYITVKASFIELQEIVKLILDTGCSIILADRRFIQKYLPDIAIQRTKREIKVCGIRATIYISANFINLALDILARRDNTNVLLRINMEVYLVNKLCASMLIGNNIIILLRIVLNFNKRLLQVGDAIVEIIVMLWQYYQLYPVYAVQYIIIFAKLVANIPIYIAKELLNNRDFFFELSYDQMFICLYLYIANANFSFIQAINTIFREQIILRKTRLSLLYDFNEINVFFAESDVAILLLTLKELQLLS